MHVSLPSRPRLWPYLVALLPLIALWVVSLEGWNLTHPSEMLMAFAQPNRRLLVWLLPPLLLVAAIFGGRWFYMSSQAKAETARQANVQTEQTKQQQDGSAKAAAVLAHKRETLEVLGLGLVVEKFRNAAVWEAIKGVENDAHATILPKEPEVIKDLMREQRGGKRSGDAAEYAMRYFVEKVPIPGFVIFPKPPGKHPRFLEAGAGTLMGHRDPFTLFITAGQIYADNPDEALGVIFDFFDTHPDVPAVYVYADDGYTTKKFLSDYNPDDINGLPGWKPGDPTEAMTAFVLVRRDRVDKLIRPFAVNEKFGLDYDDKTSFVNRVWHFFFSIKKRHTDSALPTVEEWIAEVPKLMAEAETVPVSGLLPFWERMPDGFKPSPWIPVPWTQWQLKEFDDLPTLGYLYRPQYANYVAPDGKPLGNQARETAFADAWQGALDSLPEEQAPKRMFFDAGGNSGSARGLPPMMNAFGTRYPDAGWDLNSPSMINLSARLDDTGAASPFVQIALAIIASYRDGGVSATVNLRRETGTSILMVSPPKETPEGRKLHPGAGQDPFKVPLMPENGQ